MAEHPITDLTVRSNLMAAYSAQNWPLAYSIILEYMETTSDPIFTPGLKFWFQGAIEINSNAGTPVSDFVRTYTETSFAMLGEELSEAQLQAISDQIATTVIEDILGVNTSQNPADDWMISDLPTLVQDDVGGVLSFDGGARPLAAWGGTPLAESKLGLDGWLETAITSGDDLRIFFEASRAAIGAAFLAAGRTMDLSMLGDGDALSLHGVVIEIQKIVNIYEATGQPVDWDSIYSAQHDRLFKILKGVALEAIDPDDPALAALTDEVHAELYSTLATFAELMSPGLPDDAAQEAANAGQTLLIGSTGNNTIVGNSGANIVFGGEGHDTLAGAAGDDTLNGGEEEDTLAGGAGDDMLDGSSGDDTLSSGAGNDTLDGGDGKDMVSYADSDAPVQIDVDAGTFHGANYGDSALIRISVALH